MRKHAERTLRLAVKRNAIDVPSGGIALDLGYGLVAVMIRHALNRGVEFKEIEAAGFRPAGFKVLQREARIDEGAAKRLGVVRRDATRAQGLIPSRLNFRFHLVHDLLRFV